MKSFSVILLAALFFACAPSGEQQPDLARVEEPKPTKEEHSSVKRDETYLKTLASTRAQLLQGIWQHNEDKRNYLVFEDGLRKEYADGLTEPFSEPYSLAQACGDAAPPSHAKLDAYIFCSQSDMCWYIVELDGESLILNYTARGNTLNYRRVSAMLR